MLEHHLNVLCWLFIYLFLVILINGKINFSVNLMKYIKQSNKFFKKI